MRNTEQCINKYFDADILGNIAVRVGRNDEILFDVFKSRTGVVDENTLFDMASVTKIIATTSLALLAVDQGLISPDDKVEQYFPCPEDKSGLTIKHLLTHTMGIGHKPLNKEGNTYENIADYILHIPGDIPIGENVLYSCPGFILLGKILEKVFGQRLDVAFSDRVAMPLGMTSTGFLPDINHSIVSSDLVITGSDTVIASNDRTFINSNLSEQDRGKVNDYNCRFLGGVCGNAGVFSNLTDMTAYVGMLLRHGAPLFSEKVFEEAVQNHTAGMDESRGLGFLYVDERYKQTGDLFPAGSIGHCGHTGQSVFVDLSTGLYVIILSDATISTVKKYGREHYDEVMQMRCDLHNAVKADLKSL